MKSRNGVVKGIRWAARIIGLVVTAFFLMMIVGDAVISIQEEGFKFDVGVFLFVIMPVVIALGGFITSWWRERIGGYLLILTYLLMGFSTSVYGFCIGEGFHFRTSFLIIGSPFLVAGVLFLIASWLSRRAR